MQYELLLADGRKVLWEGETGMGAAMNYADLHREDTVIAYRAPRHGIFLGVCYGS